MEKDSANVEMSLFRGRNYRKNMLYCFWIDIKNILKGDDVYG